MLLTTIYAADSISVSKGWVPGLGLDTRREDHGGGMEPNRSLTAEVLAEGQMRGGPGLRKWSI